MPGLVLQGQSEIAHARKEMRARGVSMLPAPWVCRMLSRFRMSRLLRGDLVKSWDVWHTAKFLEEHVPLDAKIVDLGAYHSEIPLVLHRLGFTHLHGIDLNPAVIRQPYRDRISYRVADFYHAPFADGSFAAITSISAIEHGLDVPKLLTEVSRLLSPGGYFLCSTDYWPTKIDTSQIRVFGLTWTIFCEDELREVIRFAQSQGLRPVGPLRFAAESPVVRHAGKDYTFAWFVLRKE